MNSDIVLQVTRDDTRLVRRTLRHLTAAHQITCLVVIIITALVWWNVLKRILAFGRGIDYSGLHALGAQTVTLLQQYNPIFWWGIIALGTLLIIYALYGFVASTQQRARRKLLTRDIVAQLASQLSEPGLEVMKWAWQDRRNPMTVGNLQQTLVEMRSNRASKITLARQHEALLDTSLQERTHTKPVAFNAEM